VVFFFAIFFCFKIVPQKYSFFQNQLDSCGLILTINQHWPVNLLVRISDFSLILHDKFQKDASEDTFGCEF